MTPEELHTHAFIREVWCHRCKCRDVKNAISEFGKDCEACAILVLTSEPPYFEEREKGADK